MHDSATAIVPARARRGAHRRPARGRARRCCRRRPRAPRRPAAPRTSTAADGLRRVTPHAPTGAAPPAPATRESLQRSVLVRVDHSRVQRLDRFLGVRFGATRDPDHAADERQAGPTLGQRSLHEAHQHRFQLPRRAGKEQHDTARLLEPQARRAAVRVVNHDAAGRHHRLTPVDLRHLHTASREARPDVRRDRDVLLAAGGPARRPRPRASDRHPSVRGLRCRRRDRRDRAPPGNCARARRGRRRRSS